MQGKSSQLCPPCPAALFSALLLPKTNYILHDTSVLEFVVIREVLVSRLEHHSSSLTRSSSTIFLQFHSTIKSSSNLRAEGILSGGWQGKRVQNLRTMQTSCVNHVGRRGTAAADLPHHTISPWPTTESNHEGHIHGSYSYLAFCHSQSGPPVEELH